MKRFAKFASIALIGGLICFPSTAHAYIGPGAGLGVLSALWGVLLAVLMAFGIILYWPVKVLIRKLRGKKPREEGAVVTAAAASAQDSDASGDVG